VRGPGDHLPASRGDGVALYTIGHSTRPIEELTALLDSAGVRRLVDVRTVPRSRRNPQFEAAALARSLVAQGIEYRHEPALGGFRRPAPDSPNGGWQQAAFRGYADYMRSPAFAGALAQLIELASKLPTSIMCAEAQWWRCHRRLISDALVIRGWHVLHLGLRAEPVEHELTEFAVVGADFALSYPPAQGELEL
jgi:uncharacterized protein (DUF488 family)